MGLSHRRTINQMLEVNSRDLGYPPWDLSGGVKGQFNVTAATGGDIISSNVQVKPVEGSKEWTNLHGEETKKGGPLPQDQEPNPQQ